MGGIQPVHAVARLVGEDGGFGGLPGYFGYRVGAGCGKAPPHFGSGSGYRHIPIAVSICHGVAGVDDIYLALAADAAGGGNHPHVGQYRSVPYHGWHSAVFVHRSHQIPGGGVGNHDEGFAVGAVTQRIPIGVAGNDLQGDVRLKLLKLQREKYSYRSNK